MEYASAVFANFPQSLSKDLEKLQKRTLSIIYPNCSYEDALKVAGIDSLEVRRNVACKRFIETILPGNPLYPIIHNCPAPQNHGYNPEEVGQAGRKASWVPVPNCARGFIDSLAVVE